LLSTDFFYQDWLEYKLDTPVSNKKLLPVKLSDSFFDELAFDNVSLSQYRIDAARLVSKSLGDNPALCLSGGVDSQSMILCWLEAGLKFDVITCIFNNDLNNHDVETAFEFGRLHNLTVKTIPLNVTQFLSRENIEYAIKYKSASPHFNVHYKLFNILRDMGYSGVCCGGVALYRDRGIWGNNLIHNIFNFINYVKESHFPVQGSFLSYYPHLSWAIGLLTKELNTNHSGSRGDDAFVPLFNSRYLNKVEGYKRAGLNVISQKEAYTGFEKVKEYYASITKDGYEFEKRFRIPLEDMHKLFVHRGEGIELDLTDMQKEKISSIYSNNMRSCL